MLKDFVNSRSMPNEPINLHDLSMAGADGVRSCQNVEYSFLKAFRRLVRRTICGYLHVFWLPTRISTKLSLALPAVIYSVSFDIRLRSHSTDTDTVNHTILITQINPCWQQPKEKKKTPPLSHQCPGCVYDLRIEAKYVQQLVNVETGYCRWISNFSAGSFSFFRYPH